MNRTEYKNKWAAENRDRYLLTLKKGEKEKLQAIAKAQNKSLNKFIIEAIYEKLEREKLL